MAIAQDKTKFVSCGEDRSFFVWDVSSGNVTRRIQGHPQKINAVALNKDATVAVTASYDQTVKCWDLRASSRDPIQVLDHFKDSVTALAVSDAAIVAGSVDGCVRTYDMRAGLMTCDNVGGPVTCVRLSSDKNTYLATCLEGSVRLVGELLLACLPLYQIPRGIKESYTSPYSLYTYSLADMQTGRPVSCSRSTGDTSTLRLKSKLTSRTTTGTWCAAQRRAQSCTGGS